MTTTLRRCPPVPAGRRAPDVLVIGAGVVGASVAHECATRGARVLVLDAARAPAAGCSGANAGIVAPGHVAPLATLPMLREGVRHVRDRTGAVRLVPRPAQLPWLTRLTASARPGRVALLTRRLRELADRSFALHAAYPGRGLDTGFSVIGGLDVWLDPARARRAAPSLTGAELTAAEPVLTGAVAAEPHPGEARVESARFIGALLGTPGVTVRRGEPVRRLVREGRRITAVVTGHGTYRPRHVVLAAGLASQRLAAQAGLRLPMAGGRGHLLDVTAGNPPSRIVRLKEHRVVITPFQDRVRVCGTMEIGTDHAPPDPSRLRALRAVMDQAMPGLGVTRVLREGTGLRPCLADGVPAIGASGVDGLAVATGHGMWGLVLGPVTGELIATGLLDDAPTLHEPSLSPLRFS